MSRRIVFLILLAGINIECRSVISRPLNLDELVASSDTIVTGVATDVRLPQGSQPSQVLAFICSGPLMHTNPA